MFGITPDGSAAGDSGAVISPESQTPGSILASTQDRFEVVVGPEGATLNGPDGVMLDIPAGAVQDVTTAYVARDDAGYDLHIDGPWTGLVTVALPAPTATADETLALAHYLNDGDIRFEPHVVVGGRLIAKVDSLSILDAVKCLRKVLPNQVVKCVGRKEIEKQVAQTLGKKAAREISCGDVTDIIGTITGESPCHVGESEEDIRRWKAIEAEKERKTAEEDSAADQAARDQAARDQAAREQAAREQAAREQAAREQAAREQAAREQAARDQADS